MSEGISSIAGTAEELEFKSVNPKQKTYLLKLPSNYKYPVGTLLEISPNEATRNSALKYGSMSTKCIKILGNHKYLVKEIL